jgi:DNA-binding CsgD family transcriptional regulator/tetratricopeptide (TPR) repeat protein
VESERAPFVGRGRERQLLHDRLLAAARGQGGVVFVAGDAGIGKSRLVAEFARAARTGGARVLFGRAHQEDGLPPYLPFADALREYVRAASAGTLRAYLEDRAPDVALVVDELHHRLPELAGSASATRAAASADHDRYGLFEHVVDFVVAIARSAGHSPRGAGGTRTPETRDPRPLLLVLDDLHWADVPSLRLLLHLGRRVRDEAILVVGAYRDTMLDRGHPLREVLTELVREGVSDQVALAGLTAAEVALYIELLSGEPPSGALSERVYRETEGNPLFMVELMRLLATAPHVDHPDATRLLIPDSIYQVIGRRLDHLSAPCHHALTLAAIMGRDFSLPALECVLAAGTDGAPAGDALLEALEEAEAARVITAVAGASGRFSFAHPLIRDTLSREVFSSRRIRLHRQVGRALEGFYPAGPGPHLAELAYHFVQAAPGGDVVRAVHYARQAGDHAMHLYAYEDAARLYASALTALDSGPAPDPDSHHRCDLSLALGSARSRAGQTQAARDAFLQAAELARGLGDAERLARAGLGYAGYRGTPGLVDDTVVALLEEVLTALGERAGGLRARAAARLAMELYHRDVPERRDALTRAAIADARNAGDPAALAAALVGRHYALHDPDTLVERTAAAAELVHLAQAGGDRELQLQGHYLSVIDLLEAGEIEGVDWAIAAHERLSMELRQPLYLWRTDILRATQAILEGRYAEGRQRAQQAVELGQRAQIANTTLVYGTQMIALCLEAGGLETVEPAIKDSLARVPGLWAFKAGLATLYQRLGRLDEARTVFEQVAVTGFERLPRDDNWLSGMDGFAEVCAALGDRPHAAVLYDLLCPYARRTVIFNAATGCLGSVARLLGLLASTLERWDDAERHFEEAIRANTRLRARPLVARTRADLAAMLLHRDAPGDQARATTELAEALTPARTLCMVYLVPQITALIATLPAASSSPGRAPSSPARPAGLSEREMEVLRRIAAGRTSREIATELVLSRRTVDHHVARIYRKIGANRRTDAAAFALRHGLL